EADIRETLGMNRARKGVRHFMVDKRKIASALCAAFCAIEIGAYPLGAFQQPCCPGLIETALENVNVVNTESVVSEPSKSGEDVPVIFEAAINFGKPNVDISQIPRILEDALMHLTSLCRAEMKPVPHPFRQR